jgi:hypothetical protein
VRDLERVRIKAAMTSCSISPYGCGTSDDVEDASRWWTRPQERIVRRLGSIAIPSGV